MRTGLPGLIPALSTAPPARAEPALFDVRADNSALGRKSIRVTPASKYSRAAGLGRRKGDGLRVHDHLYGSRLGHGNNSSLPAVPPKKIQSPEGQQCLT